MTQTPKTVSIRHLQTAVKSALEASKKKHSELKIDPAPVSGGSSTEPVYLRYPWICGLPPFPWPESRLQEVAAFNKTFVAALASDKSISMMAPNGNFEPTLYASGGNVTIGFVPSEASLTE
jgi:hypothetical protein